MNKMVRENIVTKLEREGAMRKHGDQIRGGSEKTWQPDGMGESEEACLTITTKRYTSLIEICFEVYDIA